MPKLDKPKKATAARVAAHPTSVSKSASSKKKKVKIPGGAAHHSATLEQELESLANPGKLKPIKGAITATKKKPGQSNKEAEKEELKLENQLKQAALVAASKQKGSSSQKGRAADDSMVDDGEDQPQHDFDDEDEELDAEEEAAQITARMSQKILQSVHAQQQEEMDGEGEEEERAGGANSSARRLQQHIRLQPSTGDDADSDLEDLDGDEEEFDLSDGEEEGEDVELSLEDQAALEHFMPKANTMKSKTLADLILEKIREKEEAAAGGGQSAAPGQNADEMVRAKLDPKIVEVYTKVGKFLSHYSSGKIPKAFKVIPNLKSWEEVLFLTAPEQWSCQAHFVATRIFASNFNPKMAQRFYAMVLLPKIREDIESHKHLNFHLYQSIKKALYKPAAFFKGLLLPLAEEGCTAREAVIFASILNKCTIPVLHSSVALLKLAQMPFSPTTSLFIKTLLNKKYSLPLKVLAQLVQYFCSFLRHPSASNGGLPLIWHQTLLIFVQRYKFELTANQMAAIKNLVRTQTHHAISTEIRRELLAVQNGQQQPGATAGAGQFKFNMAGTKIAGAAAPTPQFTSLAASLQNPQTFSMQS